MLVSDFWVKIFVVCMMHIWDGEWGCQSECGGNSFSYGIFVWKLIQLIYYQMFFWGRYMEKFKKFGRLHNQNVYFYLTIILIFAGALKKVNYIIRQISEKILTNLSLILPKPCFNLSLYVFRYLSN